MGNDIYENKSWVNISMPPPKEKVRQLSCGYDFSLAVSEAGNLYASGQNFLQKLNLQSTGKFQKLDLGFSIKVDKAKAGYTVMALLLIDNEGQKELWSAGNNTKGALGTGENVTMKSAFGRLSYDSSAIKFVDMDIYLDHAAALTEDGQLYQWGWNQQGRCGIRDRDLNNFPSNIWMPKKVEFFQDYTVHQMATGSCHTVVLASPKKDPAKRMVFAYGRDDANAHHLGVSNIEASKDDEFIKHLKRFDTLNVYKIAAGLKCTFVCCEGEESLLEGRYRHTGTTCNLCSVSPIVGPLHFTIDKANKKFKYWCLNCAKSSGVPDVCFALKAPIGDMEKQEWPDLLQDELIEAGEREFTCDFLKTTFSTERSGLY